MKQSVWEKISWTWQPASDREAGDSIVRNFLLHWFPAKISTASLSWGYSFWLGTISAVLFLILTVTGVILMFLYVPSVERAYLSVKDIEFVVSFGWFIRGLHRVAAHLMVAFVFLHMMRVFLTAAYRNTVNSQQNRPLNWVVGVVLLLATLLLSFTGYLLPWDQLAFWAITVGTNIASAAPLVGEPLRFALLGGSTIDQSALLRFYVLHCFFLPVVVLLLFSYHMWRVRKDGGLACADHLALSQKALNEPPVRSKTYSLLGIASGTSVHVQAALVDEDQHTVASSPNLSRRLAVVLLATFLVASVLTLVFRAPLEEPANPSITPNPAKAPWYFLWLQELVTDTTFSIGGFTINGALIGGIVIPALLVAWLVAVPWLDKTAISALGVWWATERRKHNFLFLAIVMAVAILTIVGTYLRGPYWNFYWPWQSWPDLPRRF
ncbi:MAG TPA: cytochrome b N-terminal domain-containing protein [Acidobacteriota bacterium]|nr:cytochrome b N-terminal domain-containing protein [Acidobacteriota bacterium]